MDEIFANITQVDIVRNSNAMSEYIESAAKKIYALCK